jgi:uncharacterized protein (TIGR00369 family)
MALIANEERRRSSMTIGLGRPRILRVIDVVEPVPLAQTSERVGVKAEAEAEVEERGVLAQRNGAAARRGELDGRLEKLLAVALRGCARIRLGRAQDVHAARHACAETGAAPNLPKSIVGSGTTGDEHVKEDRRRDLIAIRRSGGSAPARVTLADRQRDQNEHRGRAPNHDHHQNGDQLHAIMLTSMAVETSEMVRRLEERFSGHPVRRFLDFRITELAGDRCVMSLQFKPEFDNTSGAVHGGILAMLADTAVAFALSMSFDGEMNFATSSLNIHFLRRASTAVTATATIIKKGSKVCVGTVDLHDIEGSQVATSICEFVLFT